MKESKKIGRPSKSLKLRNPNGRVINTGNLYQYCKRNKLSQSALWAVANGQKKSYKGYTVA